MKSIYYALFLIFLSFPAFAEESLPASQHWLKPVDAKYVCMVNDTLYTKPQIPVEVNKKTYYGCCMGCVSRLQNDLDIRTSIDPVSGKTVDKATAIIGGASDNSVYYFESLENLQAFEKPKPKMDEEER